MTASTKTGFTGTNKQLAAHIVNNLTDYTVDQEEKLRATNKRILDDMTRRYEDSLNFSGKSVERDEAAVRGYGVKDGRRKGD